MIKNKKEIQGNEVFAQGLQSDIASEQLNDILGKDIVSSDISQSDESGEIRQSLDFLEKEKESYIHVDKEFGRFSDISYYFFCDGINRSGICHYSFAKDYREILV